jgi:hypothetical protein
MDNIVNDALDNYSDDQVMALINEVMCETPNIDTTVLVDKLVQLEKVDILAYLVLKHDVSADWIAGECASKGIYDIMIKIMHLVKDIDRIAQIASDSGKINIVTAIIEMGYNPIIIKHQ